MLAGVVSVCALCIQQAVTTDYILSAQFAQMMFSCSGHVSDVDANFNTRISNIFENEL